MSRFPIAKKDKREIIEDFIEHLKASGVVFAEESEDGDTGNIVLDVYSGIPELINSFLANVKKNDEESE